jgi:putative heme iron utilization protein
MQLAVNNAAPEEKQVNRDQRKKVQALAETLEGIKAELETLQEEEQDKVDNLPDNLQASSKADEFQEAADKFQEMVDGLEEVLSLMGEVA